jgi:hypothetical protein
MSQSRGDLRLPDAWGWLPRTTLAGAFDGHVRAPDTVSITLVEIARMHESIYNKGLCISKALQKRHQYDCSRHTGTPRPQGQ